jgi:hypothetical protein
MKKTNRYLIFIILILGILFAMSITAFSSKKLSLAPNNVGLTVDYGEAIFLTAYNINGNNYFKIRDLAQALNGSAKQFAIEWDGEAKTISLTTAKAYKPIGDELALSASTAKQVVSISTAKLCLNGSETKIKLYEIGNCNYLKLRDLAALLKFGLSFESDTKAISIKTKNIKSFPQKIDYIDYNEVSKIEYKQHDEYYVPLYSVKEKDKIKIKQIVSFYNNQIVPKLAKEKLQERFHTDSMKYNLYSDACLSLTDGQSIYISFGGEGMIYQEMPDGCYYFRDTELEEQFSGMFRKSSKAMRAINLRPWKVHIGDRIYISADYIPGNQATVELTPNNRKTHKPIIIKTVPLVEGKPDFHFNFVLTEHIGKTEDGSVGKISPGEWSVSVGGKRSGWGSISWGCSITILEK